MLFGGKVIRVEVFDENNARILEVEKNFVLPKNMRDSEDSIVIIKGKNLPEVEYNKIVSVVTTTRGNDRIKYTGSVSMSMDTQLNIKILQNNETQVLQERRRFFKIKTNEPGRILFYVRDEQTERFDCPLPIKVLDINVGGVFVTCEAMEFLEDDLICMEIDLSTSVLNAAARILRVQRAEDGSVKGYGCEFQGLTASQEDCISRFIMKVQSDLRQKASANNDRF